MRASPFASPEYAFDHVGFEQTFVDRISPTCSEAAQMMKIRPNTLRANRAPFVKRSAGMPTAEIS